MIPVIIGAVVGGVGGGIYAGTTSYDKQKEQNNGKINKWIVARDAFIGSVAGSTVGGVSGLAAGGTITVFGSTSLVTSVAGGVFSAVNGGIVSRVSNEYVSGMTAHALNKANIETYAYTETKTAEEMFEDALEAGADPQAMLMDGSVGGLFGVTSYGFSQALKYNKYKSCGDISTKAKQTVVDDVLDKTDDVANMVDDATGNTATQGVDNSVKIEGRGSTGRTIPNTLNEQMAMHQVKSNPLNGAVDMSQLDKPIIMSDSRWPASEGWVKMSNNVNGIEIHFVYNKITGAFDDFKFK